MNRRRLGWLVVALAVCLTGCPHKRRPVIADATGDPSRTGSTRPGTRPVDEGPDLQAIPDGTTTGEDLLSGEDGEGGPLADVQFEYDQSRLTAEAERILEKHVVWLQTHRDVRVTVQGHCDERGTVEYNLALGEQRARAARDYLVQLGVAADRLNTVSFGKERPIDTGNNEAAWARNRRAHFAVTR